MKRVRTSDLVPGMITAEDIFNYERQLILPKGSILTDKAILKLTFYSILQIRIEDTVAEVPIPAVSEPSYVEKFKSSPEFIEFKENFEADVDTFKNAINELIEKNEPLDLDKLMSNTLAILNPEQTKPNVFEMLHCMREYDDATYIHCMNVALICNMLAKWLRFDEQTIRDVTISGLLHDVGKTKIPDSIIKKPDKLTQQEYDIVKRHPREGYDILKNSALSSHILNAVLMHHERCDGTGYPDGLTDAQIDSYAKIVAIADVYDALTSARVYRGPLCPFKAIALFEKEGLQKYDVHYILTFLENVINTYYTNTVRLNNGVTGKIIFINKSHLAAPTIQTDDGFLDLSKHPELYIEDII
ncbi:MAG: HD-GYP domain-containing protein [Bacillus sp. (in: Bacteria)]|nr:HD-GYP domain-containing protein [Bacillus sp. (in: firmicutes)]MCM1427691.1 HD-GYP domain-containing protein [Eubacterium sp.]